MCEMLNEQVFNLFKNSKTVTRFFFLLKFCGMSGAKEYGSCRSRKILQNEASLAIVAVHTAENEPLKIWGYSFSYSVTSLAAAPIAQHDPTGGGSNLNVLTQLPFFIFFHRCPRISISSFNNF